MRRNPGQWLRERLFDRVVAAVLLGMVGMGWLIGVGLVLWTTRGLSQPIPEWMVWTILLPGAGFVSAGLYRAKRGWRLADMRKGASAEERIGQVIEYAVTSERCAVAHHVEDIAKVGDIDHLVATPRGLWVIETKHGRVPTQEFRETLWRIAHNVAGRAGVGARGAGDRMSGVRERAGKTPEGGLQAGSGDDQDVCQARVADARAAGGGAGQGR